MPQSIGKSGSSKISSKNIYNAHELGTVDSNHKQRMKEFRERRQNLDQLKEELEKAEDELTVLSFHVRSDNYKQIHELKEEVKRLTKEIELIENNKEELKYMLDAGQLLFDYYDRITNPVQPTSSASARRIVCPSNSQNRSSTRTNSFNLRDKRRKQLSSQQSSTQINSSSPNNENLKSKKELLDEWKSITDPNWARKAEVKTRIEESVCVDCNIPKILHYKESKYICPSCGEEELTMIDSDRPSFKDPPPDANYFAYKRINHFNELLAQFQAKESTHIPKEVFDTIHKELKKQRKTVKDLDYDLVKEFLKKHKDKRYDQYYDHIFHIINRMNGDKPLTMTPEMENNLRYLFLQIQEPFDKYCPTDRKNFLSYTFVFFRFCQLLGYTEYLKYFPLLKSKNKLYQQEKIFQQIMEEIGLPHR